MCVLRSEQPGQLNVRAVLRHFVRNKGLHPLRCLRSYPSALCSGGNLLSADTPAAKSEIREVQGTLHPGQGVGACGSETHSDGTQVC